MNSPAHKEQYPASTSGPRTPQWKTFPLDTLMAKRMDLADGSGALDRTAIDNWQASRMQELLRYARENSPFYARHLSGIEPDAIHNRNDIACLPRITADDIRSAGLEMVCVSQDEIARIVSLDTSGTSGTPKRLYFSQDDLDRTGDFFTMGMQAVACEGDTVLALLPDERPSSVGRLLAQSVINMGARPLSGSISYGGEVLAVMAMDEQARVIVGSPLHLRTFALGWQAMGFPKGIIHTVLLCWDAVPQAVIELLHEILGCRVLTHWGMTETGLGGALTCNEAHGMHLREYELLAEIIDPATGTPLPDGEWGELTITTLCRRAMPLIRYRTGDHGRILPAPCPCGSPLRRLDHSPGRLQDDIPLPDGQTLRLIDLDEALLPLHGILDYKAYWHGCTMQQEEMLLRDSNSGHIMQNTALPLLEIAIQVAPIQPQTTTSFSLSHVPLAEVSRTRLSKTTVLANSLAQQQIRLQIDVAGEDATLMDHSKRRIRQVPAASGKE